MKFKEGDEVEYFGDVAPKGTYVVIIEEDSMPDYLDAASKRTLPWKAHQINIPAGTHMLLDIKRCRPSFVQLCKQALEDNE